MVVATLAFYCCLMSISVCYYTLQLGFRLTTGTSCATCAPKRLEQRWKRKSQLEKMNPCLRMLLTSCRINPLLQRIYGLVLYVQAYSTVAPENYMYAPTCKSPTVFMDWEAIPFTHWGGGERESFKRNMTQIIISMLVQGPEKWCHLCVSDIEWLPPVLFFNIRPSEYPIRVCIRAEVVIMACSCEVSHTDKAVGTNYTRSHLFSLEKVSRTQIHNIQYAVQCSTNWSTQAVLLGWPNLLSKLKYVSLLWLTVYMWLLTQNQWK